MEFEIREMVLLLQLILHAILLVLCGAIPALYDQRITLFSPNGELLQASYAEMASQRGRTVLAAISASNEIIVCTGSKASDKLLDRRILDQVQRVDDHLCVAFSGLRGDGQHLVRLAREFCSQFRNDFGVPPPLQAVVNHISSYQHDSTLIAGDVYKARRG